MESILENILVSQENVFQNTLFDYSNVWHF